MANKRRAPRSIPASMKELYRDGQRIRFHGFWLGEKEMDRTIAEWLSELPDREVSAIVKTILYSYITGRTINDSESPRIPETKKRAEGLSDAEEALSGMED